MITVYLICAEINGEKLYKIGYTRREVEKRVKELKTGNAADFHIVESFKSKWGTKIESQIHRRLKNKKVDGEWFQLNNKDVEGFIDMCEQIDHNLEIVSQTTYYMDRGDF
jgi:hypothetical protein